jgi:hypothetical protein
MQETTTSSARRRKASTTSTSTSTTGWRAPVTGGLVLALGLAAAATATGPIASAEQAADAGYTTSRIVGLGQSSARDIAVGDLNGDGDLDLVAPDYSAGVVRVALRQGTSWTLSSAPAATGVQNVDLADADGDGDLDVVTANIINFGVDLYLNNGTGVLTRQVVSTPGMTPSDAIFAQLDADAAPEIVVANYFGDDVQVLDRQGDASYAAGDAISIKPATDPSDYALPHGVVARDLNGDGRVDLATANRDTDNVSVLTATSTGGYDLAVVDLGSSVDDVDVADLDGDGAPELVARTQMGEVKVLDRSGAAGTAGTWTVLALPGTGAQGYDVAIADIDGDGAPEIVAAAYNVVNVYEWRNGAYVAASSAAVTTSAPNGYFLPSTIAASDLDEDGDVDLVASYGYQSQGDELGTLTDGSVVDDPDATVTTPVVTGQTRVGQTLQAGGAAVTPPGAVRTYQWVRHASGGTGSTDIAGATGESYTLTSADLGATLSVRVTASATGYDPATAESARTATITAADTSTPITGLTARATGGTRVGEVRTATTSYDGDDSVTLVYQWQQAGRGGTWLNLPGAAAKRRSYELPPAVMKVNVRVLVGAVRGTATAAAASAPLLILPGNHDAKNLRITGTPRVGKELTATFTDTDKPAGLDVVYTWTVAGTKIRLSGRRIDVPAKAAGKKIFVDVRLIAPGYHNQELRSPSVEVR